MEIIKNKIINDGSPLIVEKHESINKFNNWENNLYKIDNILNYGFKGETTDGLQLNGDISGTVTKLFTCNKMQSASLGDECASIVNGADFIFKDCVFSYNGKGVLQGSGDSNLEDIARGTRSIFYNCLFLDNSRRNPFIQSGQSLIINCGVMYWGRSNFHEKSFGIRVGKNAQVTVINTVFLQDSFMECIKRFHTFKDTFGQYFWPFWIGPGFRRAAYADWGGQIVCYNCYKNRKWLHIQNHRGKYMSEDEAELVIANMRCLAYDLRANLVANTCI